MVVTIKEFVLFLGSGPNIGVKCGLEKDRRPIGVVVQNGFINFYLILSPTLTILETPGKKSQIAVDRWGKKELSNI